MQIEGPFFCFGVKNDAERIIRYKAIHNAHAEDRIFGIAGSGYKWVPDNVKNDGTIPREASQGFLWCGIGFIPLGTPAGNLEIPGLAPNPYTRSVFKVSPKWSAQVFVGDMAPFDDLNAEGNGPPDKAFMSRGRTLVYITDYEPGKYRRPVVLICRTLMLSEVDVITAA